MADDCELWLLWNDQLELENACFLHSQNIRAKRGQPAKEEPAQKLFYEKKLPEVDFTRVNKNIENNKNVVCDIFEL